MVSPVKLGREPVGSPTKIGSVSRPMAVAVFCAAENQPADDDEQRAAPADLRVPDQVVQQRLGEEGVSAAVPAQVDDEPARRRSAMKANSRSQKAANGSAGWSATALYWK